MTKHTVYLAQAGEKNGGVSLESLHIEEWEAEKRLDEWEHDCVEPDEWWFSVTELTAT